MDKLLARAIQAKNQAARRLKKYNEVTKKRRLNNARKEHAVFQNMLGKDRRTTRREEREDYRLGPIAPRRAVGKEELEEIGAFDQSRIIPPAVPYEYRIKYWNIVEKDRVVILKGPDRHKIGTVKSLDKTNNTLIVEGMNKMPMKVPEAFKKLDADQPSVISREQPSHYNDVRLVFPLPDPVTGALKDTIVANITMSKVFHDRREDEKRWTRYIAGTDITIPWPAKEEKEYIDHPADTRIMDVEMKTYIPSLLKPPFPGSVVDELRNKYSKFRIRHEPEFVKKIQAQERKRQEKEVVSVRTPVQELNRLQRVERKARGPPVLTEEMLEKIGRVMAQNRPELLERIQAPPEIHA